MLTRIFYTTDLQRTEADTTELENKRNQIVTPELPAEIKFSKELLREKAEAKEKLNRRLTEIRTKIGENKKRHAEASRYLEQRNRRATI